MKHAIFRMVLAGVGMTVLLVSAQAFAGDGDLDGERVEVEQPVNRRFQRNLRYNHDRGLFVRVAGGVGYGNRTLAADGSSEVGVSVDGIGVLPELSFGWLPVQKTALHLSGWGQIGQGVASLSAGPGVTHYFDARENLWISAKIGVGSIDGSGGLLQQWMASSEVEAGLYGWSGPKASLGGSLFGGVKGLDVDGDGAAPSGWHLGIRVGMVYN